MPAHAWYARTYPPLGKPRRKCPRGRMQPARSALHLKTSSAGGEIAFAPGQGLFHLHPVYRSAFHMERILGKVDGVETRLQAFVVHHLHSPLEDYHLVAAFKMHDNLWVQMQVARLA